MKPFIVAAFLAPFLLAPISARPATAPHATPEHSTALPKTIIALEEREVPFIKRHQNHGRDLQPDLSVLPADFNDLPIKTSVSIDGEDITIYALRREHVETLTPILKDYLCADPEYAPLFPILCHGDRKTKVRTTRERTTGGRGRSTSDYGRLPSGHGTKTQYTTPRAKTTRTTQDHPTSERKGKTGPSKTIRGTGTTSTPSSLDKSRPNRSTTLTSKSSTEHRNGSRTSTGMATSGGSHTLPQNTKARGSGNDYKTVSTRPSGTDNDNFSPTNVLTGSTSVRSSASRSSTSTARPMASSDKNDTVLHPSRSIPTSISKSTSSNSHRPSFTKSPSTIHGGFSHLTRTMPMTSGSASRVPSTSKRLPSISQPQNTSASLPLPKSSVWTDTWDTQTYQSTIERTVGVTSATYSLTETSPTSYNSEPAGKIIVSPTVTNPPFTETNQDNNLPLSTSTSATTSSNHWREITSTEVPSWSTLQTKASSSWHTYSGKNGPVITRTKPEWPKELTGTITVWPYSTITSLAKRSSTTKVGVDVAISPTLQEFGNKTSAASDTRHFLGVFPDDLAGNEYAEQQRVNVRR